MSTNIIHLGGGGPGVGQIGFNWLPPLNSMQPVPKGAKEVTLAQIKARGNLGDAALPDAFSWANPDNVRQRLGVNNPTDLIYGPGNQGSCGSCYAYASTMMLQDRWAIATRKPCPTLSVKVACSCRQETEDGKKLECCDGGLPYFVGAYFESNGVPADSCFPYGGSETFNNQSVTCDSQNLADPKTCQDEHQLINGKRITWYAIKGSNAYLTDTHNPEMDDQVIRTNIEKIKHDLYANGPLVCDMFIFEDFPDANSWPDGIYKYNGTANKLGGHSVEIVGYGPTSWLIKNSWGTIWGSNGYCKVYDGLHGNKGVGFDHCVKNGDEIDGGAYTWLADPKSGYAAATTTFFQVTLHWWVWVIVTIVAAMVAFVIFRL